MDTIINVENLTCLVGNRAILSNIDWKIKKGDHWVVFGLNGSGKTTLLSILAGYRSYTSGKVEVFGAPYTAQNILEKRKRIGWISSSFYDKYYTKESVLQIVLAGVTGKLGVNGSITNADIKKAKHLLTELGMTEKMNRTFDSLSKGERQSVLIARELMTNPEILILDEPGTGLDIYARERMLSLVKTLAQNPEITIIYVTHYTEEILNVFDQCLLLKHGRIYAKGNTQEIFQEELISDFLETSAKIKKVDDSYYIGITDSEQIVLEQR